MQPGPVIALVRHADYKQPAGMPSAMLPYALTEDGVRQAHEGAERIGQFARENRLDIARVIDSSHMLRAWQTASIIGATLLGEDCVVSEFDELAERSVGAVANMTVDEIERVMADDPRYEPPPANWKADSHYRLPFQGAESLMDAGVRVATHIERALRACIDGTGGLKIIVGHGASIRHAALNLGLLSRDRVQALSMYHARPVFVTKRDGKWEQVGGDWKVRKSASDGDEIRE
ncbi:MAG: histidine phosphatase family protein [Pseudomonadales bacterium]|nr:histidine phosphatase family protein [Pseudomonadales bacterium]